MTLGTHVVVGVAVAELFPSNPMVAFFAAFASHFLLDAIPHWDYKLLSDYANPEMAKYANNLKPSKLFLFDLMRIGFDVLLGIVIVMLVWPTKSFSQFEIILLGALGGALPDFLQFVYARFPRQPMVALQKFHEFIHAEYRLDGRPIIGIVSQSFVAIVVILLAKYLIKI